MSADLIAIAQPLINSAAPSIIQKLSDRLKKSVDNIRAELGYVFGSHLALTLKRCREVKTIVSSESPVALRDIYVNLELYMSKFRILDDDLIDSVSSKRNAIVVGTAGAGKTMMMKYISLNLHEKTNGKIPLYINLRELDDPRELSLINSIYRITTPQGSKASYNIYYHGLKEGLFWLLLDGLDEIRPADRDSLFRQMQRFHLEFPDCKTIISSRPEVNFSGFDMFDIFHIKEFDKNRSIELLRKTPFHSDEIKNEFISKISGGLYEENESFLSIPLLALIMLLTYNRYASIPSSKVIFYNQAFSTLYHRHDASKPYVRSHFSGLREHEFVTVFSMICARTLQKHKVSFYEHELIEEIITSLKKCEMNEISASHILSDLLESICLMYRDGLQIHFVHRSFQEYFAAKFLISYRGEHAYTIFDKQVTESEFSDVAVLVREMNIKVLEREWVLPTLEEILPALRKLALPKHPTGILHTFFDRLSIDKRSGWAVNELRPRSPTRISKCLTCLAGIYSLESLNLNKIYVGARMQGDGLGDFLKYAKDNPYVLSGSMPFEDYIERGKSTDSVIKDADKMKSIQFNLREGGSIINRWIRDTGLSDRTLKFMDSLERLISDVRKRVEARDNDDVYD